MFWIFENIPGGYTIFDTSSVMGEDDCSVNRFSYIFLCEIPNKQQLLIVTIKPFVFSDFSHLLFQLKILI